MPKLNYTKGEWSVQGTTVKCLHDNGLSETIARIEHGVFGKADNAASANARLIAASPDLLSAVELIAAGHLAKEGFVDAAKRVLERNNLI